MKPKVSINIIEAIKNPQLFGSLFKSLDSWAAWLVWLKAVFGLPMDDGELALFQKCTGRISSSPNGVNEVFTITGRRGGKSRIASVVAVFIGCFYDFSRHLSAGERGMVLVLGRDRDQARVGFNYIAGTLRSIPVLEQMVVAWRGDEIELNNGIIIAVNTSDFRSVRGLTVVCCIADEVSFWESEGVNPDKAVFAALRPAMVTIPGAKLLVITTPYGKFGEVFEAYRNFYGRDDAPVLVWQADTRTMNPCITEAFIAKEMERDPEAARSEWLAQFREDIEAAFTLEMIESCIIPGRTELLPAEGVSYSAFVDPSGGRHDQFALAIGHRSGEKVIVDLLRGWQPPIDPSVVVAECANLLSLTGSIRSLAMLMPENGRGSNFASTPSATSYRTRIDPSCI